MHCNYVRYTFPTTDLVSFDERVAENIPKDESTGIDCFGEKFMLDVSFHTKLQNKMGLILTQDSGILFLGYTGGSESD